MTLTEDEAKKKWCPLARVAIDSEGYSGGNRFQGDGATAKQLTNLSTCIGSACMAWRFAPEPYPKFAAATDSDGTYLEAGSEEPPRPADVGNDWVWDAGDWDARPGWKEPKESALTRQTGYCGMAGDP